MGYNGHIMTLSYLPCPYWNPRNYYKSSLPLLTGIYLDKIAELCGGLPLALLMTGSELEQDDGLLDPCDMVELLNKCRLKVLSQDLYPIQERIGKLVFSDGERISIIY